MIWIASIISAICYRIGGAGREEIKFANSQYRDIGCPVVILILLLMHGYVWYLALLSSLLVLGFIRTYWDSIFSQDNMYMHGIGIGASLIPLCWSGVAPLQIAAYTTIIAITMGGLNTLCTRVHVPYSVWIEECWRGFIIVFALKITNII